MNVGVLFSGGKDSTFALSWAVQQGWDIRCLITLRSANPSSFMFHTPNISLTSLQAECLDLPIVTLNTQGNKEEELADLKAAIAEAKERHGIDTVVTGAVASDYQEERVNRVCHELGLRTFSPLWHKNQSQLLRAMISEGFAITIAAVAGMGLGESFLGATIDEPLVAKLESLNHLYGINVAGEGGEFESLVVDCPLFKKRLIIDEAEKRIDGEWNGVWAVKRAHAEEKTLSP